MAAQLTLQVFTDNVRNRHIKILVDNTTAVSYINKQGGRKLQLNEITLKIWSSVISNGNWITCTYLPGIDNDQADAASRDKYA